MRGRAEGEVEERGYVVGSPRLFEERGISLDPTRVALARVERAGETPVILGDEDGPLAGFGLATPTPELPWKRCARWG